MLPVKTLGRVGTWSALGTGAWTELLPSNFGVADATLNEISKRREYVRVTGDAAFSVSTDPSGANSISVTSFELNYAGPLYVNAATTTTLSVVEGY